MSASQTYERPALRKAFAAFAADSKVANASLAVIARVVSTSDKLPPPLQPAPQKLQPLRRGTHQWPTSRGDQIYHAMSLPPTLWKSLATASSRFSGLASIPLMASDVNRPREMKIGMASLLEYFAYLIEWKSGRLRALPSCGHSAHVGRPPLGFKLNDSLWLRR